MSKKTFRRLAFFQSSTGVAAPMLLIILVVAGLIAATAVGTKIAKQQVSQTAPGQKAISLDTFSTEDNVASATIGTRVRLISAAVATQFGNLLSITGSGCLAGTPGPCVGLTANQTTITAGQSVILGYVTQNLDPAGAGITGPNFAQVVQGSGTVTVTPPVGQARYVIAGSGTGQYTGQVVSQSEYINVLAAATPTPQPTVQPTNRPTATATPRPNATATSRPSGTATPRPNATATPRPSQGSSGNQSNNNQSNNNGADDQDAIEITPDASTGLPPLRIPCRIVQAVCQFVDSHTGNVSLDANIVVDGNDNLVVSFTCGQNVQGCSQNTTVGSTQPMPCSSSNDIKKYCDYAKAHNSMPQPSGSGNPSGSPRPNGSGSSASSSPAASGSTSPQPSGSASADGWSLALAKAGCSGNTAKITINATYPNGAGAQITAPNGASPSQPQVTQGNPNRVTLTLSNLPSQTQVSIALQQIPVPPATGNPTDKVTQTITTDSCGWSNGQAGDNNAPPNGNNNNPAQTGAGLGNGTPQAGGNQATPRPQSGNWLDSISSGGWLGGLGNWLNSINPFQSDPKFQETPAGGTSTEKPGVSQGPFLRTNTETNRIIISF